MKRKFLGIVMIAAIAVATGWGIIQNNKNVTLSDLALANVEALANEESGGGLDANYNRHPFNCTIYGNGKVQILGGNILKVNGSLTFEGGLYCSKGGSFTCTPIECAQVWQWIFD